MIKLELSRDQAESLIDAALYELREHHDEHTHLFDALGELVIGCGIRDRAGLQEWFNEQMASLDSRPTRQ